MSDANGEDEVTGAAGANGGPPPLRVAHLIPNLRSGGGAQAVLYRLIVENAANEHRVITLLEKGTFAADLEARGVAVHSLGLRGPRDVPRVLAALYRALRRPRPDVLQTWMYHADLLGGLLGRLARVPVVWGLHHTSFEKGGTSRGVRWSARLCAPLSRWGVPARIVSCSRAGVAAHEAKGYAPERLTVVHNGYDTEAFTPRPPGAPDPLRAELGLSDDTRLLGMAARHDPQKDHANLLAALAALAATRPDGWRCLLFGSRMDDDNAALGALLDEHGLRERVILLGRREDVIEVMRSLDLHVLSSRFGEAFPNVLNEAMLVGTPCVTTRVGDAALIVGESGWTAPPSDPAALASAMGEALAAMEAPAAWAARRRACRARIVEHFDVGTMAAGYERVWRAVARFEPDH